jgi:hypothetical protein
MSHLSTSMHATSLFERFPSETAVLPFDSDPAVAPLKASQQAIAPDSVDLSPFSPALNELENDLISLRPFTALQNKSTILQQEAIGSTPVPFTVPFDALTGQAIASPIVGETSMGDASVGDAAASPFQSSTLNPLDNDAPSDTFLDFDGLKIMRKKQVTALSATFSADTDPSDTPPFALSVINEHVGSLGADSFVVSSAARYSVISGNGNVFFGNGAHDHLNLSSVHSSSVRFNLAGINGPGVLYNDGKGARVFDAMLLNNGNSILFEGLDRIYSNPRVG